MSEASKAEALRLLLMPLDEVEAELDREARLFQEVLRSKCVGGDPKAGQAAWEELATLRLRAKIAARRR